MIESKRLTIRPVNESDTEFLIELLNEPDFLLHIGNKNVHSRQDALRYMNDGPLACQSQHGFSLMTVTLHDGPAIGLCGLLKRDELTSPDLGYAFLEKYYRQGFAYEATSAVLSHFDRISPLLALTSADNVASQSLLLKLGFKEQSQTEKDIEEGTRVFKLIR